jgi:nitrite reductase/ring-hydroxylating ferredoxin subunit
MPAQPKIRYFLILTLQLLALISCSREENDVIPDVYVNFTIDLLDFPALSVSTSADTVDRYDMRVQSGRSTASGYSDSGIILYRHEFGFYAMDMTCPHDYEVNKKIVRVRLDGIFATCPVCETVYQLPANGTPSSGPGRYYLKNYKTNFDGRFLLVWNNY